LVRRRLVSGVRFRPPAVSRYGRSVLRAAWRAHRRRASDGAMPRTAERDLTALDAAFRTLTSTVDLAQILRGFLEQAQQVASPEGLSLLLYDDGRDELGFAATR